MGFIGVFCLFIFVGKTKQIQVFNSEGITASSDIRSYSLEKMFCSNESVASDALLPVDQ